MTGSAADRYRFGTSPLRNVGPQPASFHDGALTDLAEALPDERRLIPCSRATAATPPDCSATRASASAF